VTLWYEQLFDERYLTFYPVIRREPVAAHAARQVADLLGLGAGQRVLDLGCGTGRYAVALARLGLEVTGLDLSRTLLSQARETARREDVALSWLERDMRDLDDLGPFEGCVSLYTAFGFLGDEEDQEVLRRMLARAGLQVERVAGAPDGRPFSWAESPNQVYLCVKPVGGGDCL